MAGIKQICDFVCSIILIVIFSPVLLIAYIISLFTVGLPVFYYQRRPGLKGEIFTIYKFRTMSNTTDADGTLLPDSKRLNWFGRLLRATSIDELPELFNVVRGEMSLVGPRPLLVEYLERYTPEQARRHDVRPGITGWAQINGRQTISFSKRLELDIYYVEHWSLWLDVKILLLTLPKLLFTSGVINGQDVKDVDDLGLYRDETAHERRE